ncbi:MAG: aconitase family protein [Gemmatimonadota bacterium]|nr:aconitase family protein [Gemmatimonadota bacterium]
MTIAEKILARASGLQRVGPGDVVEVEPDVLVLLDGNFMRGIGFELSRVAFPDRIVVVFDHFVPAEGATATDAHARGREFVERFGIDRFHDVGPDQGISHQLVCDLGYVRPGQLIVSMDSHTCAAGSMNALGGALGPVDMAEVAVLGRTWFRCGPTVRYELSGVPGPGVAPKDVFLEIAGRFGDHTLANLEFVGSGIAAWSVQQRKALATMCSELGAQFAAFPFDETLAAHLGGLGVEEPDRGSVNPDPNAFYEAERQIDLAALEPMVALPHGVVGNTVRARDVGEVSVSRCFVGSCANGTLDDLREAAEIVNGRRIANGVRFIVTPGSAAIHRRAADLGYVRILEESGAVVTASACGSCAGLGSEVAGAGERVLSSSTRNYQGRMGSPKAQVYLASTATVAASALAGRIASPLEVI